MTSREAIPMTRPDLRHGQRMDQPTFHARYEASPDGFRAELIGGIVSIMPPATLHHSNPHSIIAWWLGEFSILSPGTDSQVGPTIVMGGESEPEPDVCLLLQPTCGGRTRLQEGYIYGAPELMVEIAISSASRDLGRKKRAYQLGGVDEYLLWHP